MYFDFNRSRGGRLFVLGALLCATGAAARAGAPASQPTTALAVGVAGSRQWDPVQRLDRPNGPLESLDTKHFHLVFDPRRITREKAEDAGRLAEHAWSHCEMLFGETPESPLRMDLSPRFLGATGFYKPGDPRANDPDRRPMIGVRYADLDYLGLAGEYVLTHEIGHAFSSGIAGSSLGEGIADWAAGTYAGLPMRQWWGQSLQDAGLWVDPDAFFVTGSFEAPNEVDAVIRTAQYSESGLLVQFLVNRFGWNKVKAFAAEYGKARGPLTSNGERREIPQMPRGFRRGPGRSPEGERERDPRLPPEPEAVRAVFERHFGETWPKLLSEWERGIRMEKPPQVDAERLVLAFRIYGAIRNYEMWLLRQRPEPGEENQASVRQAFTRANRLLADGKLDEARAAFAEARSLVDQLRKPRIVASLPGTRSMSRDLGRMKQPFSMDASPTFVDSNRAMRSQV